MVKIIKADTAEELEYKVNKWVDNFKDIKVVGYGVVINNLQWYEKEYSCMLTKEN